MSRADSRHIVLAAKIASASPELKAIEIAKALEKLKKLAKTIGNRQALGRNVTVNIRSFDETTKKFHEKASELARGLNCEFVAAHDGKDDSGRRFYLRVGELLERIS